MQNNSKRWQRLLCLVPFVSTVIILIVTYVKLAKRKVDFKKWLSLIGIMAGATLLVFVANRYLLTGDFPFLNWLLSAVVFTGANLGMIDLQTKGQMNEVTEAQEKKSVFSRKKTDAIIIVILAVVILAVFCGLVLPALIRAFRFESKYEDLNGEDDYSLCVITEENVLQGTDCEMWMSGSSFDGNPTNVEGLQGEDVDWDECYYQAEIFDGVCVAQATRTDQETITLSLTSTVTQGNFEIFILIDGEIYGQVSANCEKELQLNGIQNRDVLVVIAGEGANFTFAVIRTV